MEKGFDLKRFGLMVRWDLMTNWKSSVRIVLSMALGLLLMYELNMMNTHNAAIPAQWQRRLLDMVVETNIAFVFFMLAGAALIFVCMKTRQQRIAFIMLPASPAEKFLSRLLYATVGFFVMFFAASVIADVLRLVICLIVGPRMFSSVVLTGMGELYDGITGLLTGWDDRESGLLFYTRDITEGLWDMATFVSMALFVHALYLLGGSLFRRHALLSTTFSLIAIGLILGWLNVSPYSVNVMFGDVIKPTRIFPFFFGVLTVLCYWGAYRIYCRMQVINNKWINL
ncbi:MAG: hypothetical protein K2L56_05790 [Prevotella sp.]|nr:hypothetical protein [Prevotella sp.]